MTKEELLHPPSRARRAARTVFDAAKVGALVIVAPLAMSAWDNHREVTLLRDILTVPSTAGCPRDFRGRDLSRSDLATTEDGAAMHCIYGARGKQ